MKITSPPRGLGGDAECLRRGAGGPRRVHRVHEGALSRADERRLYDGWRDSFLHKNVNASGVCDREPASGKP